MLYIIDESEKFENDFYKSVISLLSEQRLKKVERLRTQEGKNASACAYLLLRFALMENYEINDAVVFEFAERGKPKLKDHPHIHFNLSHSHNLAACAVADVEVGIDVQRITEIKDKVARRVLTADEYTKFKNSPNPDEYFCEVWTIKESLLKMTGQGIAEELRDISADSVAEKMIYKVHDYFCCVCLSEKKTKQQMKVKYIRREDFDKLRNR